MFVVTVIVIVIVVIIVGVVIVMVVVFGGAVCFRFVLKWCCDGVVAVAVFYDCSEGVVAVVLKML